MNRDARRKSRESRIYAVEINGQFNNFVDVIMHKLEALVSEAAQMHVKTQKKLE